MLIYPRWYVGNSITGTWLENQGFPKSVILGWRGSKTLTALKKKGIQLHAIIGFAKLISKAGRDIENRYSFEKTKEGATVKDLDEILESLKENQKP
jgi:hypothetical protein